MTGMADFSWPRVLPVALLLACSEPPLPAACNPVRIAAGTSPSSSILVVASRVWPEVAVVTSQRDPFAWPGRDARIKPSLADYPPQRLLMVGSLQRGRQLEALLQDPLGRIYRVRAGMRLGPGQIEVLAVDPQAVHLRLASAGSKATEALIPLHVVERE